jgi:hypothetical protein
MWWAVGKRFLMRGRCGWVRETRSRVPTPFSSGPILLAVHVVCLQLTGTEKSECEASIAENQVSRNYNPYLKPIFIIGIYNLVFASKAVAWTSSNVGAKNPIKNLWPRNHHTEDQKEGQRKPKKRAAHRNQRRERVSPSSSGRKLSHPPPL